MSSESEKPNEDRRRHHRFTMSLPLLTRLKTESSQPWIRSTTLNVSAGGVCFSTRHNYQPGDELEYVILLPREITLTCEMQVFFVGRIIRVDPDKDQNVHLVRVKHLRYHFLTAHELADLGLFPTGHDDLRNADSNRNNVRSLLVAS